MGAKGLELQELTDFRRLNEFMACFRAILSRRRAFIGRREAVIGRRGTAIGCREVAFGRRETVLARRGKVFARTGCSLKRPEASHSTFAPAATGLSSRFGGQRHAARLSRIFKHPSENARLPMQ